MTPKRIQRQLTDGHMMMLGFVCVLLAAMPTDSSLDAMEIQDQMQAEMKAALDSISNQSGYSFSVCFCEEYSS